MSSHWEKFSNVWKYVYPPLRPSYDDIRYYEGVVDHFYKDSINALLLGVTPEISLMTWPKGTNLIATDLSLSMIKHIWPYNKNALCCSWDNFPLQDESMDFIIGDGCFSQLPYPTSDKVIDELHRLLKPNSYMIHRFFCRPNKKENPLKVLSDLKNGNINNFHIFRFRLAMSLYNNGVRLGDVYDAWYNAKIKTPYFSKEVLSTIEPYKDSDTIYMFPTIEEVEQSFIEYFDCAHATLKYEFGERCPIFVFRKRVT